jgi:hypothetical protein
VEADRAARPVVDVAPEMVEQARRALARLEEHLQRERAA